MTIPAMVRPNARHTFAGDVSLHSVGGQHQLFLPAVIVLKMITDTHIFGAGTCRLVPDIEICSGGRENACQS